MKKIDINFLIISLIIGIILGTIAECALIYDIKLVIKITQTFSFWGLIMILFSIIGKDYKNSILSSSIAMLSMNATYYLIRFNKSGYTNIWNWQVYSVVGIAGSIYFGMLVYCIKKKIKREKILDNIPKYSLILMTIIAILFTSYYILNGFRFFNLFVYYAFMPGIYGVYLGAMIGCVMGVFLNKKEKVLEDNNE